MNTPRASDEDAEDFDPVVVLRALAGTFTDEFPIRYRELCAVIDTARPHGGDRNAPNRLSMDEVARRCHVLPRVVRSVEAARWHSSKRASKRAA